MSKLIGRECKFVIHLPEVKGLRDDTHFIKEVLHYDDKTTKINLQTIKNFKRPFYVTKPHFQNHKQKKEFELESRVNTYYSTQSRLANNIAVRIGKNGYFKNSMRDVVDNQFLYGVDIKSSSIIKKIYQEKYPDCNTESTVCALDIENDIDTGVISIISIAMYDKLYTVINKSLVDGIKDIDTKLKDLYDKWMPDTDIINGCVTREYDIFDNELELVMNIFKKVHEWQPDFLAIWNINYDLPVMMRVLDKYGVKHEDVFSDPSLPDEFKYFRYKEGQKQRVTESGRVMAINPEQQWHYAYCTSSFIFIDAMCAYSYVRVGQAAVPGGYGLDNVLRHNKINTKLKFDDDSKYKGADWHKYMVKNKPLEYIIYNQYDILSMLELENKTKDLTTSLPILAGISDFDIFNSGPKKIVDGLHFFYLQNKRVLGTKPSKIVDDKVLGLDNWIITLPAYRLIDNGIKCIAEDGDIQTNIRCHVYDIDAVSSYPSDGVACNISKQTTKKEIVSIKGKRKEDFMYDNINLFSGAVNSVEYCTSMFNFPQLIDLAEEIKKEVTIEE